MAIIRSGLSARELLEVDSTSRAVKVTFKGAEMLGGFRMQFTSGTIAASTAAGIIYAFQYFGTNMAVVTNVSIGFRAIAGNTVGSQVVSLWPTRSYTVIDSTGAATAPTLKGQTVTPNISYQMQTNIRIANTGMISGGTGTDDANPYSSLIVAIPGNISPMPVQSFFSSNLGFSQSQHPMIFAQNEGFRIRADTIFGGGTDTEVAIVNVEWIETASYA